MIKPPPTEYELSMQKWKQKFANAMPASGAGTDGAAPSGSGMAKDMAEEAAAVPGPHGGAPAAAANDNGWGDNGWGNDETEQPVRCPCSRRTCMLMPAVLHLLVKLQPCNLQRND